MTNLDKQFKILLHDPFDWLNTAKNHLISANCIDKRIAELIRIDPDFNNEENDLESQALMNSCLFLVGIGLENAIKGYIVAQNQNFKELQELNTFGWQIKSGHGISEMFRINCAVIYSTNKDFLDRIEEYLIWLGKYSTPKMAKFLNVKQEYYVDDVVRATSIISEIEEMINKMNIPFYYV
ncbi:MAG: hypothetical protein WCP85_19745 [Mariniphaga sp.]